MSLIVSVIIVAARVPARVLPGALGDEAEVRPAPAPDRAVPDELPAARARVEGDPRRPGRRQLVPLLDAPPRAGAPDLAAPLQPVRGHARARLHLAAVRRAADLRLAREPRPAPARGGERPRREPPAGVPARDAAAVAARRRRRVPLRLHPDARRVRDAVARRRRERLHVRQPDRRPVRHRLPRLGDRLGARAVPARRRRRPDGRVLALPAAAAGGRPTDGRRALEERRSRAARVLRARDRVPLRADRDPADLLVQRLGRAVVPAQRVHAALVPRVPRQRRPARLRSGRVR